MIITYSAFSYILKEGWLHIFLKTVCRKIYPFLCHLESFEGENKWKIRKFYKTITNLIFSHDIITNRLPIARMWIIENYARGAKENGSGDVKDFSNAIENTKILIQAQGFLNIFSWILHFFVRKTLILSIL